MLREKYLGIFAVSLWPCPTDEVTRKHTAENKTSTDETKIAPELLYCSVAKALLEYAERIGEE